MMFSRAQISEALALVKKFHVFSDTILEAELKLSRDEAHRLSDMLIIQGYIREVPKIGPTEVKLDDACKSGCKGCPLNGGCADGGTGTRWQLTQRALDSYFSDS